MAAKRTATRASARVDDGASSPMRDDEPQLQCKLLTPSRWKHLETLFGERGACGGCWCMYWRQSRKEFEAAKGANNKRAFRQIVESGGRPGMLGFIDGEPIAWCAVAPRETYITLERSRILKPVDDQRVWSISCFFVRRDWRRRGIAVQILEAVIEHVAKRGGRIVEGYPVEPTKDRMPDAFAWTGTAQSFLRAGFTECARRSPTRPIMRFVIDR